MESIFAAFPKILDELETNAEAREAFVFAAWPRAVGEGLSEHTMPVELAGTRLRVAVANLMWQRHLETMAAEILAKLNGKLVRGSVGFIEFFIDEKRITANRKPRVERLQESVSAEPDRELRDLASAIEDQELREAFLLAATSLLARRTRLMKNA